jgi:hypothetical protein
MLQDQISARLCPEYFTVFHPPIRALTDPTLLGISWGFLGAWWGGIILGLCVGFTATLGSRPKLSPRELVCPLAVLVCVVAIVAALTGFTVWHHSKLLGVSLAGAALVPPEHHLGLLTVACYHFAAYASATIGGVVLCVWVWRERGKHRAGETACPMNSLP